MGRHGFALGFEVLLALIGSRDNCWLGDRLLSVTSADKEDRDCGGGDHYEATDDTPDDRPDA